MLWGTDAGSARAEPNAWVPDFQKGVCLVNRNTSIASSAISYSRNDYSQPDGTEGGRDDAHWVTKQLAEVLGEPLTTVIAGASNLEAAQTETLSEGDIQSLATAWDIVQLLREDEAADTIRAWFAGKNQLLGDRAPARVLREDPAAVMQAARAFSAYG